MALEKCDHLLEKVTKPKNYTHIIRQHLLATGGPYPSLEKMAEAQQLLLQNKSVIETAYELGYKDSANFSRAFKKATGKTPSAYVSKLFTNV